MSGSSSIHPRIRFYWMCVSPTLKWVFLAHSVLAGMTWVRDELLPEQWRSFHVIDLLPSWPWELWLSIGILIVGIALIEGVFRLNHLSEDAKSHHKQLFDSSGKPYQPLPSRSKVSLVIVPSGIISKDPLLTKIPLIDSAI